MPDDNKRTSLDVLLSIEEKLSMLIKTIATDQLTSKLILDKLNKIDSAAFSKLDQPPVASSKPSKAIDMEAPTISVSEKPIIRENRSSVIVDNAAPPPGLKTSKKQASPVSESKKISNKMPIVQRVVDSNNKDIFMASVKIRERESNEIHFQCKTNAVGKWQAVLPPGKYRAEIVKNISDGNKIEAFYDFELSSDSAGSLPNLVVNK